MSREENEEKMAELVAERTAMIRNILSGYAKSNKIIASLTVEQLNAVSEIFGTMNAGDVYIRNIQKEEAAKKIANQT